MRRRRRASVLDDLECLPAPELRAAFACLLATHAHLAPDLERIVRALSAGLGVENGEHAQLEAIARELGRELVGLDVLDLSIPRAEPWRYRSESDDTWARLHRAVAPTVEAMHQLIDMGRPRAALTVLQGILLALYSLRDGGGGELLQSAPDFPTATARWIWDAWWKGTRGRPPLPAEFVTGHVPEWTWLRGERLGARRRRS